jgi:hypothetical protein
MSLLDIVFQNHEDLPYMFFQTQNLNVLKKKYGK